MALITLQEFFIQQMHFMALCIEQLQTGWTDNDAR